LLTNNRLGWKGLRGTNILAYYKNLQITTVKSFSTLARGSTMVEHSSHYLEIEDLNPAPVTERGKHNKKI
jgi:hypothetical protein